MQHQFQVNLRGVIDLLSEHLYSGPEVYVRELLQNAVDASTARIAREKTHQPEILIECHAPKGKPPSLVFTDNGVGLTGEEVHKFLSTIGLSSKKKTDPTRPSDFIGQFGIGILSCFVVSEEIVVITKSATDSVAKPVEWRAKSDGTYTVKELEREIAPGTQVWLTAKSGTEELFSPDRLKELIKHYGGLLPYPIRLTSGRSTVTVNEGGVPWRTKYATEKERSRAMLAFGKEAFGTKFFDAIPLVSEVGHVDGVAFVLPFSPSATVKRTHRVYLKNMFLSDRADNLLPEWAFFVQAVVNANDLRPTASREAFYDDAKLATVRTALGEALRQYLVNLAESRPERLEQFIELHHRALKALAAEDDEFFRIIIDWLPFETNRGLQNFGDYRQENERIRYVADVDSFRQISKVAAAQGICLINAGYTYDQELLAKVSDAFPDLSVERLDTTSITQGFEELTDGERESTDGFLERSDRILKPYRCQCDIRKFQPENLLALYSTTREGRFFRSVEQSKEVASSLWSGILDGVSSRSPAESSSNLCFNYSNPIIRKLATIGDKKSLGHAIRMLYVQSLLLGHHPLNANEMAILNDGILALIEAQLHEGK